MRWSTILMGVAALSALLVAVLVTDRPEPGSEPAIPPPEPQRLLQTNSPLAFMYSRTNSISPPEFEYLTTTDRLLLMIDPLWFERYQGSYTLEELQSRDGTSSFSINSAWLLNNPSYPQVGILIRQDPEGNAYRVSGGEVFLPKSGVGISVEKNDETDDTRAFLKFKKEF